jgi:hypothetical protein
MRRPFLIAGLLVPLLLASAAAVATAEPRVDGAPVAEAPATPAPLPAVGPGRPHRPMRVTLVRDDRPGCGDGCREWISAEGDFDETTPTAFEAVFRAVGERPLPVLLHSWGGSAQAGLAVGRMLRARRIDVMVARTVFGDCLEPDPTCPLTPMPMTVAPMLRRGQPVAVGDCFSACVFALAGGERRLASAGARIGVHQVRAEGRVVKRWRVRYREEDGRRIEVGRELVDETHVPMAPRAIAPGADLYRVYADYFRSMGLADGLVPLMESAEPSRLRLLAPSELAATRLAGAGELAALLPGVTGVAGATAVDDGSRDPYRDLLPSGVAAMAPIELETTPRGRGVLRFSGGVGGRFVVFTALLPLTARPIGTARVGLRIAVADHSVEAEATIVEGATTPVTGRLPIDDFCRISAGQPATLRPYVRLSADSPPLFRSATTPRPADLARMRSALCGS